MRFVTVITASLLAAAPATAQDYAKPGTEVTVGQSVVIPYKIPKGNEVPVELTVTEVEKGTLDDLAGFQIPDEMKDYLPWFVRYTWTNLSDEDLSHSSMGAFYVIDDRNQQQTGVRTQGKRFDKCRDESARDMVKGKSATGCDIYMIHKDGGLKTVIYKGTNPDDKPAVKAIYADPIRWIPAGEGAPEPDPAAEQPAGKVVN